MKAGRRIPARRGTDMRNLRGLRRARGSVPALCAAYVAPADDIRPQYAEIDGWGRSPGTKGPVRQPERVGARVRPGAPSTTYQRVRGRHITYGRVTFYGFDPSSVCVT